ncbi:hypothetical protein QAD02_020443 [Eretmocerus hayati]|uniref:Uncharacterized protein n=1 Tax=Eretmocerus hayati TaxID=131215 RepID=A0ACC2PMI6_9HYME|nr:hypothetical protein QAD02_020443 [Eretmocerus hayati]
MMSSLIPDKALELLWSSLCHEKLNPQCRTVMMVSEAMKRVSSELFASLPCIDKRYESFKIHHNEASAHETKGLEACNKCGRILRSAHFRQQHVSSHILENNFPMLEKAGPSSTVTTASCPRK